MHFIIPFSKDFPDSTTRGPHPFQTQKCRRPESGIWICFNSFTIALDRMLYQLQPALSLLLSLPLSVFLFCLYLCVVLSFCLNLCLSLRVCLFLSPSTLFALPDSCLREPRQTMKTILNYSNPPGVFARQDNGGDSYASFRGNQ